MAFYIHIARPGMWQQLVALHVDDVLLRGQPLRQRRVRLDRRQMGQKDGLFRHPVSRSDIFHRHELQSELRDLHGAEDREWSLFSCHLSNTFHTRYVVTHQTRTSYLILSKNITKSFKENLMREKSLKDQNASFSVVVTAHKRDHK